MRAFFISALLVLLLGGAALFYFYLYPDLLPAGRARQTVEEMKAPPPPPPARGPQDYHMLEGQGGIPRAEGERAGLVSARYAYLSALTPVQISEGVAPASGIKVRGLSYDFCYQFATSPPREQYLEFNLEGKWHELHFGFGFDDAEPTDPTGKRAITLIIKADGQVVYGPVQLKPELKPVFAMLDVTGIYRLTFISQRDGQDNLFAPVLLDPFVKNPTPAN